MQSTIDANTERFYREVQATCTKIRYLDSISHSAEEAAANFRKAHMELEIAKENLESARDVMIRLSGGQSAVIDGIEITHFAQKGAVDYKAIPELKEVDLDQYRKPSSVRTRVSMII